MSSYDDQNNENIYNLVQQEEVIAPKAPRFVKNSINIILQVMLADNFHHFAIIFLKVNNYEICKWCSY